MQLWKGFLLDLWCQLSQQLWLEEWVSLPQLFLGSRTEDLDSGIRNGGTLLWKTGLTKVVYTVLRLNGSSQNSLQATLMTSSSYLFFCLNLYMYKHDDVNIRGCIKVDF